MTDPIPPKPKKRFTKFKLIMYALALVGLGWLGIQAYWGFFRMRIWLAGFGTGAFWILGLITGFIYFYAAHRIYERIRDIPRGAKKAGAYTVFSFALIAANPLPWSLLLWIFFPPGDVKTVGHWFFIGCSVATVIVVLLERMFAKKKPKPELKP